MAVYNDNNYYAEFQVLGVLQRKTRPKKVGLCIALTGISITHKHNMKARC